MAKMPLRMTYLRSSKTDDTLKQMLEAMAKRIESIGNRVEEIGTKVSDLEAQRVELVKGAEELAEPRLDNEEVEPPRPDEDEAISQVTEGSRGRDKVKAPCFGGSLNPEDLLDWIGDMEKYFEWKEIKDPRRVRFTCTRLKGHATRWWENL